MDSTSTLNMLVVERDPTAKAVVRMRYEKKGYHVDTADSAERVVELLAEKRYAIVAVNVGLPDPIMNTLSRSSANVYLMDGEQPRLLTPREFVVRAKDHAHSW